MKFIAIYLGRKVFVAGVIVVAHEFDKMSWHKHTHQRT